MSSVVHRVMQVLISKQLCSVLSKARAWAQRLTALHTRPRADQTQGSDIFPQGSSHRHLRELYPRHASASEQACARQKRLPQQDLKDTKPLSIWSSWLTIKCNVSYVCTSSSGPATSALWGSCASSVGLSHLNCNMGVLMTMSPHVP